MTPNAFAPVCVARGVVEVVSGAGVAAEAGDRVRAAPVTLHLPAAAVRHESRLTEYLQGDQSEQ